MAFDILSSKFLNSEAEDRLITSLNDLQICYERKNTAEWQTDLADKLV